MINSNFCGNPFFRFYLVKNISYSIDRSFKFRNHNCLWRSFFVKFTKNNSHLCSCIYFIMLNCGEKLIVKILWNILPDNLIIYVFEINGISFWYDWYGQIFLLYVCWRWRRESPSTMLLTESRGILYEKFNYSIHVHKFIDSSSIDWNVQFQWNR